MRVLITGGNGMLGRAFAKIIPRSIESHVYAPGKAELDVRDQNKMLAASDYAKDGWVIHCAALVNVEGCAMHPETARETIVDGTKNAIQLARKANARFLYPQSFLVHNGQQNPIAEDTKPAPLSFYGELKYSGQQLVEELCDSPLIVTMAGFFGGEEADKNFVGRIIPPMFEAMERGEKDFEIGDRIWQPTWTDDLAYNSLQLMQKRCSGQYQMASHGEASFADLAQEIVLALGWGENLVIKKIGSSAMAAKELGRRPDRAVLSCSRLKAERLDLQRDWRATLHAYLRHPYFNQYRKV